MGLVGVSVGRQLRGGEWHSCVHRIIYTCTQIQTIIQHVGQMVSTDPGLIWDMDVVSVTYP